jgi:hypothetical protein
MGFIKRIFSKPDVPVSLGRLVLATRRYRTMTLVLSILTTILTALIYLLLIWPAFLPSDPSNPAVASLVVSEPFQQRTNQNFIDLEQFNNRKKGEFVKRPNEFRYIDPSRTGLLITANYSLVPREDQDSPNPGTLVEPQLRYQSEFSVRISPPLLIVFVAVLSFELVWIFYVLRGRSRAEIDFENRALSEFFNVQEADEVANVSLDAQIARLRNILRNFHAFYKELTRRYNNRTSIVVKDEYDVQDILRALLMLHFKVVKPEEYTPSHAGKASRIDFLLHDEELAVEVKMTRDDLRDKEIGDELLIDIGRYKIHQKCKKLVCFIYDPRELLKNPQALQSDLANGSHGIEVEVIVAPARYHVQ